MTTSSQHLEGTGGYPVRQDSTIIIDFPHLSQRHSFNIKKSGIFFDLSVSPDKMPQVAISLDEMGNLLALEVKLNKDDLASCFERTLAMRSKNPFFCTFHRCFMTFSTAHDWKNHERMSHHQAECWPCFCCTPSLGSPRFFTEQDKFKDHLKSTHVLNAQDIDQAVQKQRVGRDSLTRFWCGFCRNIVDLQAKGLAGSNERFKHIAIHCLFFGQEMKDWIELWDGMAKGDSPPAAGRYPF